MDQLTLVFDLGKGSLKARSLVGLQRQLIKF